MKLFPASCMMCCLLALVACGSDSNRDLDKEKADKEAEAKAVLKEKTLPICPQVAIVRDLDTITDYGGDKSAPEHLVAGAKMQSVDGDCTYKDTGIDITFDLNMVAVRGPGLGGLKTNFPYFVAVADPVGAVLNKDSMTVNFHFSSDSKTAQEQQPLHVFIPLPKDKRETGPNYQVLMGFQLTKEQLEQAQKHP